MVFCFVLLFAISTVFSSAPEGESFEHNFDFSVALFHELTKRISVFFPYNQTVTNCVDEGDTGPCRAKFVKYYYNTNTKQCETLNYGGCKGNGNRYETLEDCRAKCE